MSFTACVTGADRGLGFALAIQLLSQGCKVFAGRYMPEWDQLEQAKASYGERLCLIDMDVSDDDSVGRAAATIASRTDRLDVLVNNAGIAGDSHTEIFSEIDFQRMIKLFNVNALGPLRVTNALVSLLLNSESKLLVNISSEAGQIRQTWREGWYGYCMSKAALNVQSNIVHNQIKKRGGRVLVVHPGWMKTYMSGKLNEDAELDASESARRIVETMMKYAAEQAIGKHPPFVDYNGDEMSW